MVRAIYSFGSIGPYFFKDERERAVTVTGVRYVHMLEIFVGPELARHPANEKCFSNILSMLSIAMGTSHGQPDHPIFQHVISFSGGS
jgi:hypothetical protein